MRKRRRCPRDYRQAFPTNRKRTRQQASTNVAQAQHGIRTPGSSTGECYWAGCRALLPRAGPGSSRLDRWLLLNLRGEGEGSARGCERRERTLSSMTKRDGTAIDPLSASSRWFEERHEKGGYRFRQDTAHNGNSLETDPGSGGQTGGGSSVSLACNMKFFHLAGPHAIDRA